ncbi:hypothetical protein VKS41_005385 [Umbelopsis sp. WA50703]
MRATLSLIASAALLAEIVHAKNFVLQNLCSKPIEAGVLQNGQSTPTYYTISSGASTTVSLAANWAGRTWARIDCDQASEQSDNTQCGVPGTPNPASLAEFTFEGSGDQDFYDLSMVDGYNLPIEIQPIGASQGSTQYICGSPICQNLPTCPSDLTVLTTQGDLLACQSDCSHYNLAQYCCTGAYNSAATCSGGPYAPMIKAACPDAYSFAYDDSTSTYTCPSGTATGYTITWCPSGSSTPPPVTSTTTTTASSTGTGSSGTCGSGLDACGAACYNPAQYTCINGNTLCPVGDQLCGTACYSPSQYTCSGTTLNPV